MKSTIYLPPSKKLKTISNPSIFFDTLKLFREFERYDFTDEWNNLGYGRITQDDSSYSISDYDLKAENFSEVWGSVVGESFICPYIGIVTTNESAKFIVNRGIGLTDGVEKYLEELFLYDYKWDVYGSIPVLSEIPYGYNSAVTMRIDCDETILSGRYLADLYKEHQVPFSMAITTKNFDNDRCEEFLVRVVSDGGSVLSHSHTHAPNWGGSREKAVWEATTARDKLKEILPADYNFDFVVSPFHQNPQYAVEGLRDAGIKGFVGGIIKNDPEYLVSRASWAFNVPGIMTHSQQCMLHGDCYHATGLSVYKESFDNHYKTNTFFGYLDHPFSNYQYGWYSEEERLKVHDEFLTFLKSYNDVWFANLVDAMSFLWVKVSTKIWVENDQLHWEVPEHSYKNLPDLCVLWKGSKHRIPISSGSKSK